MPWTLACGIIVGPVRFIINDLYTSCFFLRDLDDARTEHTSTCELRYRVIWKHDLLVILMVLASDS